MNEFTDIFSELPENFKNKLAEKNIYSPTKVQKLVIPVIKSGKDTVFESETGTGKTLAYLIPLFERLNKEKAMAATEENASENGNVSAANNSLAMEKPAADKNFQSKGNSPVKAPLQTKENRSDKSVKVIVLAPTFELASQIKSAVQFFSDFKAALLIGGAPLKRQEEALKEKPDFVIGTPARVNELIRLKKLKVQNVRAVVFDEADRLLKKEIVDEIKLFLSLIPEESQKIALSATIDQKTKKFFPGAENILLPKENVINSNITHWAIYAETRDKIETLRKLLNALDYEKVLIFTSRPDQVENISSKLKYKKINCVSLHARSDGRERKTVIDRFRSGKEKILITSDLSSRGLDIPGITHIIQTDLPSDDDFFIHRAGRTARAGNKGINIVIGDEWEMRHYASLEKKLQIKVYPKEIRDGKVQEPKL